MGIFCERFGELCRGLTLDEISAITGLGKTTVHSYLRGNRINPGINEVSKIADAFSVSVDWLLGRSPHRTVNADIVNAAFTLNMTDESVKVIADNEYLAAILDHIVVSKHGRTILQLLDAYEKTPPGSLDGFAPHATVDFGLEQLRENRNEAVFYAWEKLPKNALCALKKQAILTYIRDALDELREESDLTNIKLTGF